MPSFGSGKRSAVKLAFARVPVQMLGERQMNEWKTDALAMDDRGVRAGTRVSAGLAGTRSPFKVHSAFTGRPKARHRAPLGCRSWKTAPRSATLRDLATGPPGRTRAHRPGPRPQTRPVTSPTRETSPGPSPVAPVTTAPAPHASGTGPGLSAGSSRSGSPRSSPSSGPSLGWPRGPTLPCPTARPWPPRAGAPSCSSTASRPSS